MSFTIELSSKGFEPDAKLRDYVEKKVGKLDRFTTRHARKSAHANVRLLEVKSKTKKSCECEVVLHLPKEEIAVKESTINIYAAVDIVEEKLKMRLKKYHELHTQHNRGVKHILARIRSPF